MTDSMLDLVLIIGYFSAMLCIGVFSMKKIDDFDDYALAGRSIPMALVFATVAATLCGGGATIGRIAFIHKQGLIVFVGLTGVVVSQLFSGWFIAPRVREAGAGVYTVGDLFGRHYGRNGRLVAGIISFAFCVALFGVQILAMGRILETVTGLPLVPSAIISSVITLAYTWAGGMLAVVLTDAIQFVVLAVGLSIAALISLDLAGGYHGAVEAVKAMGPSAAMKLDFFRSDWSSMKLFSFFMTFMLGEMCAPYFIQRYATGASPRDSKWGVTIFGGYYSFFLLTTLAVGVSSLVLNPGINPDLALTTLVLDTLPAGISGIVFGALLSAIMSTGDSYINTASIIFTRDIYNEFINPEADRKTLLRWSRIITLVVGIGGIGVALSFPQIFELMIYVFNLWAPSIIPPLVIALMWRKEGRCPISPHAGAPAVMAGLFVALVWGPKILGEPFGFPSNVAGIAVNLAVLFTVHGLTRNLKPAGGFAPEQL